MMDVWGLNPATISAIGSLVSAAAFIATIIGLVIAYKQNRRARNLDAFLEISLDIRHRWEGG